LSSFNGVVICLAEPSEPPSGSDANDHFLGD